MYDIDYDVSLEDIRVRTLMELTSNLETVNRTLENLKVHQRLIKSLNLPSKIMDDMCMNGLHSERGLKQLKLYFLTRIKYLKRTTFPVKFNFSKDYRCIYILENGRTANDAASPRIGTGRCFDIVYLRFLFETNLVYLLISEPNWLNFIAEDEREYTGNLVNRLKKKIVTPLEGI